MTDRDAVLEDLARWLIGYLGPLQRDDLALPAVEYIAGQLKTQQQDSERAEPLQDADGQVDRVSQDHGHTHEPVPPASSAPLSVEEIHEVTDEAGCELHDAHQQDGSSEYWCRQLVKMRDMALRSLSLERDAGRYSILRRAWIEVAYCDKFNLSNCYDEQSLDAAIDAAMKGKP